MFDYIFENWSKLINKTRYDFFTELNDMGISRQEFMIIMSIFKLNREGIKVTASLLATRNNVTIAAIMHKLANLESLGMISREEDNIDKRNKYIILSDSLKRVCLEKHEKYKKLIEDYCQYMGEDNIRIMKELTSKTIKFMEENQHD